MKRVLISAALCAIVSAASLSGAQALTKETIDGWMTELSNWGRWGADDQIGTVNLITPGKRTQAAGLVKAGVSVSMERDEVTQAPAGGTAPFGHTILGNLQPFALESYSVSFHGNHSHFDSLCHMNFEGKSYNGVPVSEITDKGCGKLAVTNYKNGLVTRGILMDIPKLKGVPYLDPGTAVMPADLDAWEAKAGMKVGSGDAVFIRTGRWALPAAAGGGNAGPHASVARWLKTRDVALLGSDVGNEVRPSGVTGMTNPLHQLAIVALGMPLFDVLDLEALSAEAERQRRWEFLFMAAPLSVPGGTGSPLNPIAVF